MSGRRERMSDATRATRAADLHCSLTENLLKIIHPRQLLMPYPNLRSPQQRFPLYKIWVDRSTRLEFHSIERPIPIGYTLLTTPWAHYDYYFFFDINLSAILKLQQTTQPEHHTQKAFG